MADSCTPSPTAYPSDCEVMEGYRAMARKRSEQDQDPTRIRALARAKEIKLLLLDVDGVLTDGSLLYTNSGEEAKSFNTQDGFGLRLLQELDIATGVITARRSEIVARRCTELKMSHVYQGARNKNEAFKAILSQTGFKPFQVAYMGDDWLDLVLLQQVGLALAPANCAPELMDIAHYITSRPGGKGAVRDACDLIIEAQGATDQLLQKYKNR